MPAEDAKIKELSKEVKKNPTDRTYNDLGNAYYANNQYEEAIQQYQEARKLNPKESVYSSNIGDSYRALENLDEAIKHYQEALGINDKDDWAHNALGNVYFSKGEHDKAIECYRNAVSINPSHVYYTNIGDSYRNKGDLNKAILYYKEAIGANAEYDPAHNAIGVTYYSRGDYAMALEHYIKAVSLNQGSYVYYSNLGDAYAALERWDEAIESYENALRINIDDDISHNNLGNAYFGMGLYSQAIEQYHKAKDINPDKHPIYYSNIGDANRRLKKWDKAIEYYRLAIQKAKENNTSDETFRKSLGLAYNDRAVELYEKKEHDKAIGDYKESIKLNSEDAVIHHNLYLVYNAKNMYKEAEKSLRKAIELDPNNPVYAQDLKELLSKMH